MPAHRVQRTNNCTIEATPGRLVNTNPIYAIPFAQVFSRAVSTSAIGALQGAINEFRANAAKHIGKHGARTADDPVAQTAVAEATITVDSLKLVLEPIFEADFKSCSYGFRPNRRAQDAVAEIHHFASKSYEWVLEADIEACFDMIDHTALMDRLRYRIGDKRVLALVKAFLKAGVLTTVGTTEGTITGTPQGGILSPLLANIALSVLDDEFARRWDHEMGTAGKRAWRRDHGKASYRLIRYADDFEVRDCFRTRDPHG